jgi:hypothetical protein
MTKNYNSLIFCISLLFLKFLSSQMEGYCSCSFITTYIFELVIGMQIWFERLGKQQHLKLGLAAFTILLLLVWL